MPKIAKLSSEIIALIAAGEVIERPAYAIKELIDNAIDAGATRIRIDLQRSGLDQIIVDDDGVGMDREDLHNSFLLHTTSKIMTTEDLQQITTQGFRGEALASIASVSVLTIQSKQANEILGNQITIKNQKISEAKQIGLPTGTRVIVDHIFADIPARQKFIKTPQTELRHSTQIITTLALSHPEIRFLFRNNTKIVLDLPAVTSVRERIEQLFDESLTNSLIPLQIQESYITTTGFLAHPSQASAFNAHQYITVNGRPIADKLIAQAVKDAMQEILPKGVSPSFFLFLTIPPELVDANIHPRKETVAFVSPETIFTSMHQMITETLQKEDLTFVSSFSTPQRKGKITKSIAGQLLKQELRQPKSSPSDLTFSQFHDTYLIIETSDGILLIDQHAAHERILYEQYKKELETQQKEQSSLQVQDEITLQLTSADVLLIQEYHEDFRRIGFVFSIQSGRKPVVKIAQVPALFSDRDPVPIIEELLSDLRDGVHMRKTDRLTHRMLTYLACRSAVKAGDQLTQEHMRQIYTTLQTTSNKYTCPHGRPTMIQIPLTDLEKMFGRR